ncbi:hypothetical protein V5O48_012670, partial [Marasmius crinis-equi]
QSTSFTALGNILIVLDMVNASMKATFLSRFTNLLDTNYVPSSGEVAEIESFLRDPEERLHSLDAEISKLQAKRDELRQHIDRHRMLLSPFRRLPVDLWGEIFVQALPSSEYDLPGRTLKDAPLLLTTVCRTWRDIALKTPRLWNGIHVYLPQQSDHPVAVQLPSLIRTRKEGVKAWLDRSGSLPITFSLAIGPDDGPDPDPSERPELETALSSFFELFARYCHRLQAIKLSHELDGLSPTAWQPFIGLTPSDFPLLVDVHVRSALFSYDQSTRTDIPTPFAQLLRKLPGLRKIRISGQAAGSVLNLNLFSLSSITDLHLAPNNISEPLSLMVRLVESCPSLSSLSLSMASRSCIPGQDQPFVAASCLEWSALRSLELRFSEHYRGFDAHNARDDFCDILSDMFRRLKVPVLERLTVYATRRHINSGDTTVYVGTTMPFHDMIVRSGSPIRHLSLDSFFFGNKEALSSILPVLPLLKSLRLSRSRPLSLMRERLRAEDEVDSLETALLLLSRLPLMHVESRIEELDLHNCGIGNIDMIIATATTMPELKSLIVEFGVVDSDVARETMHSDWVREGLRHLRDVQGTRVIWKWENHHSDWSYYDRPYAGSGWSSPFSRREPEYEFL